MAGALAFACRCGALRGEVEATATTTTRVRCHCRDCRAAYTHLGQADPGMVDILQTAQQAIRLTRGTARLRVFRHSPRGALRWYAGCCGTPLVMTPVKARLVHAGLNVDALAAPDMAGEVVAEAFVPLPSGGTRHRGAVRMVVRMASRILAGTIDGSWRRTPFFGPDGAPIVPPRIATQKERAAALAALAG